MPAAQLFPQTRHKHARRQCMDGATTTHLALSMFLHGGPTGGIHVSNIATVRSNDGRGASSMAHRAPAVHPAVSPRGDHDAVLAVHVGLREGIQRRPVPTIQKFEFRFKTTYFKTVHIASLLPRAQHNAQHSVYSKRRQATSPWARTLQTGHKLARGNETDGSCWDDPSA